MRWAAITRARALWPAARTVKWKSNFAAPTARVLLPRLAMARPYSTGSPFNSYDDQNEGLSVDSDESLIDLEMHRELLAQYQLLAIEKQRVLVVQPFIRRYEKRRRYVEKEGALMLDETVALARTLGWEVADT